MHPGIQIDSFTVDALRERLRKMPDDKLREFGAAARYMCSPKAMMGKPPLPVYVVQLKEARAEWKRRHPETPDGTGLGRIREASDDGY